SRPRDCRRLRTRSVLIFMTSSRVTVVAALSLLAAIHSAPASAQPGYGGIASATVSAMTIEDGTSASIAGAIGYRFNPIVTLGVELMFVPRVTPETRAVPV